MNQICAWSKHIFLNYQLKKRMTSFFSHPQVIVTHGDAEGDLNVTKVWNVETGTVMNMCSIIYRKIFQHFFNSFRKKTSMFNNRISFLDDSTEILIGFVCVCARMGHFNYALYYFYCCWWGGVTYLPLSPLYNDHLHRKRQTKQTILNNGHS